MTKKIYVVAAVALLAVFAVFGASAEAGTMRFDHFSIDVPAGWEVEDDKENYTVTFLAPDKSAGLTISVIIDTEGMALEECVEEFRQALDGDTPEKTGDAYQFNFDSSFGPGRAILAGEDVLVCVAIMGEHDDFGGIIDSFDGFD